MSTNIDMSRIFSANGVDRNSDTPEIVLIDKCRLSLYNTKIVENNTDINNFLVTEADFHILNF